MRPAMAEIDFEAEGLLEGVEGRAREARLKLLRELADRRASRSTSCGVAVEERRLALLPVERMPERRRRALHLGRGRRARRGRPRVPRAGVAGARDGTLVRGRARSTPSVTSRPRSGSSALLDAGIPEEGVLEIARLLGMTMSQLAAANRRLIADAFMREGDTEYDVAHRFAAVAEEFLPLIGETLSYTPRPAPARADPPRRLRPRRALLGPAPPPPTRSTVCFADMVGFTQLGETLDPTRSAP